MPEWAEQQRTSQTDPLISSCQRLEKDSDRVTAPVAEAVRVPTHLALPRTPQPKQSSCTAFTLNPHWGRADSGEKKLCAFCIALLVSNSLQPCGLRSARLLCLADSPGSNTGMSSHILLEHHIYCCPSHQLPWVPGAARAPATQAAAASPHLALSGADQVFQGSFRSKPLWMIRMQRWR